jgi:putative ABC transport system substrate-binding protein
MTGELMPKRLELLSELVPQARVIALLVNSNKQGAEPIMRDMQEAARAKGVQLHILKAGSESEIDTILNVALPYIQGSLSASLDQIACVRLPSDRFEIICGERCRRLCGLC